MICSVKLPPFVKRKGIYLTPSTICAPVRDQRRILSLLEQHAVMFF